MESRQSKVVADERRASNLKPPKTNMKNDKIINGCTVRKNTERKGMWDIMETRAGKLTGKASFTGTMKEVRAAIKLGSK